MEDIIKEIKVCEDGVTLAIYGAGKVDCGGLFRSDSDTEEAAGAYRIQSGRNGRIRTADPLRVEQML